MARRSANSFLPNARHMFQEVQRFLEEHKKLKCQPTQTLPSI